MLIVSPSTATAITPHASDHSWVMFVQVTSPYGPGPIKIEGVEGDKIASRLRALAVDNAYEAMLIGLITTTTPAEHARALAEQFASTHLHDGWFNPSPGLLAFIQHSGQAAIVELLGRTHPGALDEHSSVDIDEIARMVGVSVKTIRRMVQADEIPYLRWGRVLRFVPADVIGSLQRRGR